MEKRTDGLFITDRQQYARLMAQNLPVLRASLGVSQADLAQVIGITRQTLSAAESGARELSWSNFISLLHVFMQNQKTSQLLYTFGIYTKELEALFQIADLGSLKQDDGKKEG